tara:strand:+ start:101 stop:346 length:246 start_codon:yes stop_codon:yes gene_type:complete
MCEDGTMNIIIDVIRCAEFDKKKYGNFMDRLIFFAQNEKKNPTCQYLQPKVKKNEVIPLLPPPPLVSKTPQDHPIEDLIKL